MCKYIKPLLMSEKEDFENDLSKMYLHKELYKLYVNINNMIF